MLGVLLVVCGPHDVGVEARHRALGLGVQYSLDLVLERARVHRFAVSELNALAEREYVLLAVVLGLGDGGGHPRHEPLGALVVGDESGEDRMNDGPTQDVVSDGRVCMRDILLGDYLDRAACGTTALRGTPTTSGYPGGQRAGTQHHQQPCKAPFIQICSFSLVLAQISNRLPNHVDSIIHLRGSRASRNPSPKRLRPSMVMATARPGKTAIQGAVVRYSAPSAIKFPQLAVGGWIPIPRKESTAS